jgi:hypothetical protein
VLPTSNFRVLPIGNVWQPLATLLPASTASQQGAKQAIRRELRSDRQSAFAEIQRFRFVDHPKGRAGAALAAS